VAAITTDGDIGIGTEEHFWALACIYRPAVDVAEDTINLTQPDGVDTLRDLRETGPCETGLRASSPGDHHPPTPVRSAVLHSDGVGRLADRRGGGAVSSRRAEIQSPTLSSAGGGNVIDG